MLNNWCITICNWKQKRREKRPEAYFSASLYINNGDTYAVQNRTQLNCAFNSSSWAAIMQQPNSTTQPQTCAQVFYVNMWSMKSPCDYSELCYQHNKLYSNYERIVAFAFLNCIYQSLFGLYIPLENFCIIFRAFNRKLKTEQTCCIFVCISAPNKSSTLAMGNQLAIISNTAIKFGI